MLLASFICSASASDPNTIRSGGKTSTNKLGPNAFSQPASNLSLSKKLDFSVGNSFFRNPWIPAPASTDARDGLGPIFNTNACQSCHIKDGRGHAPESEDDNAVSMLVRLSIPAVTDIQKEMYAKDGVVPEPTYGGQLQDLSIPGAEPEGQINITYQDVVVNFADGEHVTLRKPTLKITDLNYGDMHPDTQFSARVAPPMIGLGLLEAIPEKVIQDIAAKQAASTDSITGKANRVWDVLKQDYSMGRFGWKAGQPTLMQQNASAFNGDLGLTSKLFPNHNCTENQPACEQLANGGSPEVSDNILKFVEFYSQHLAVPIRRNVSDPKVKKGQKLFESSDCSTCHQNNLTTAVVQDRPALSNQLIHPYTDMLLHDMGDGLADNRPEYLANGREWRTTPLWGLGYTQEVNGHTYLLHDGRARNVMEAILWHGGEAQNARDKVIAMDKNDREALLAFLNSL
ncbi:di-heme oxidoredictase family protein [Vibrio sp. TH_r3]|uniref:di-heme oxidoreductase family protein n=1 Tax=Vibrio sp. TH_r3 TaxID=3082084 RepID=UPI0039863439